MVNAIAPQAANDSAAASAGAAMNAATLGVRTRTTRQTRKIETIAANEAAPTKDKELFATPAVRASDTVTAVDETTAPASALTIKPRAFPRTRTAT
jgi:hypothetical protein